MTPLIKVLTHTQRMKNQKEKNREKTCQKEFTVPILTIQGREMCSNHQYMTYKLVRKSVIGQKFGLRNTFKMFFKKAQHLFNQKYSKKKKEKKKYLMQLNFQYIVIYSVSHEHSEIILI